MDLHSMSVDSDARPDGRRIRGVQTRDALIAATRALMLGGTLRPSAFQIAGHAACSPRSLFHHYPTLRQLYGAALDDETVALRVVAAVSSLPTVVDQAKAIVGA